MEKKNFISMVLGTFSGMVFAVGMCMTLIPEWKLENQGVIVGILGILLLLITIVVRRKMEGKKLINFTIKNTVISIFGISAIIVLGLGIVLSIVYNLIITGIVVGTIGIIMFLCLIPMIKGFI